MEALEQKVWKPARKDRRTVVFLQHDLFLDLRSFQPLAEALNARGFEARAASLPGHGQSSMHKGELRFYNVTDYVNPFVRRVGRLQPPPLVVGHGVGAALALRAIEEREHRSNELGDLGGLALLAPMPRAGLGPMLAGHRRRRGFPGLLERPRSNPRALVRTPKLARALLLGPNATLSDAELADLVGDESAQVVEQLAGGLERTPLHPTPLRAFVPTADACHPPDTQRALAAELGADVVELPGAGHAPQLEPAACAALADGLVAWADELGLP